MNDLGSWGVYLLPDPVGWAKDMDGEQWIATSLFLTFWWEHYFIFVNFFHTTHYFFILCPYCGGWFVCVCVWGVHIHQSSEITPGFPLRNYSWHCSGDYMNIWELNPGWLCQGTTLPRLLLLWPLVVWLCLYPEQIEFHVAVATVTAAFFSGTSSWMTLMLILSS